MDAELPCLNQVGAVLRDVAVGHMGQFDSVELGENSGGQVLRRSDAPSRSELAGICLGVVDHLFSECKPPALFAGDDDDGEARERAHHLEVFSDRTPSVLYSERWPPTGPEPPADQLIAVLVACAPRRAGVAARAGAVLDAMVCFMFLRHSCRA